MSNDKIESHSQELNEIYKQLAVIQQKYNCPLSALLCGILLHCTIDPSSISRIARFAQGEMTAKAKLN